MIVDTWFQTVCILRQPIVSSYSCLVWYSYNSTSVRAPVWGMWCHAFTHTHARTHARTHTHTHTQTLHSWPRHPGPPSSRPQSRPQLSSTGFRHLLPRPWPALSAELHTKVQSLCGWGAKKTEPSWVPQCIGARWNFEEVSMGGGSGGVAVTRMASRTLAAVHHLLCNSKISC